MPDDELSRHTLDGKLVNTDGWRWGPDVTRDGLRKLLVARKRKPQLHHVICEVPDCLGKPFAKIELGDGDEGQTATVCKYHLSMYKERMDEQMSQTVRVQMR